jgi:hypothetical protein
MRSNFHPGGQIALCALAVLSGCGGLPTRDSLDKPPSSKFTSARSPAAVAACIAPLWRKTTVIGGVAAVETVPGAGGSVRLTLKIAGGVDRVVQIDASGGGSTTGLWNLGLSFGDKPSQVLAVENCQ